MRNCFFSHLIKTSHLVLSSSQHAFIDVRIGSPKGRTIATVPVTPIKPREFADFVAPIQDTNQWFLVRLRLRSSILCFVWERHNRLLTLFEFYRLGRPRKCVAIRGPILEHITKNLGSKCPISHNVFPDYKQGFCEHSKEVS
jgi:hypothetical protein